MKLIYILDPQCGWCFGNSENLEALYKKTAKEFKWEFISGGMWIGEDAPRGGENLSSFIETNVPLVESITGVKFGKEFYELCKDTSYIFSSEKPSIAMEIIKKLYPEYTAFFIKKVQEAQFVHGKKLSEIKVYKEILKEMHLETSKFEQMWNDASISAKVYEEFNYARSLVSGFPSLLLEDEKEIHKLCEGVFNPEMMYNEIKAMI
ncbi:DsbA family protein [Aureivirga marina]|uniref:DsbA family protein n=1 Tax=Aureivirga marina TaxID=1182451 RepID=UPI0018C8D7F7|nr:DsbA family protein [Aureivirga marina]